MKVAIIAAPNKKLNGTGPAYLIYSKSNLFRRMLEFCQLEYDKVYILNGKEGLIKPTDSVEARNSEIRLSKRKKLNKWFIEQAEALNNEIPKNSDIFVLGGYKHRRLCKYLEDRHTCHEPLKGLRLGEQLNYLINKITERKSK